MKNRTVILILSVLAVAMYTVAVINFCMGDVLGGIAMLPGWQASRGAQIENYVSTHFWMQGISKAVTDEIENIK